MHKVRLTKELKRGILVEREHLATYNFLKRYVARHKTLPKPKCFYRKISENHLNENKLYYLKLKKAGL
jgi:hypothetical protein